MNDLVLAIVEKLKNSLSKEMIVFIISLLPILELRGGLIAAALLKVDFIKAVVICVLGNILPIPFILLFINKILTLMEKIPLLDKFALWLKEKAIKNKPKIDKYGFWGLTLFVGIPLPGTGAWTGSLVASIFHMDIKKSSLAIFIGIILALIIMSIFSYGILANIVK